MYIFDCEVFRYDWLYSTADAKSQFSIAFMHSKVATDLENLQLLEYLKYTDKNGIQRNLALATLNEMLEEKSTQILLLSLQR